MCSWQSTSLIIIYYFLNRINSLDSASLDDQIIECRRYEVQTITSYTNQSQAYYYFNQESPATVSFDSCNSDNYDQFYMILHELEKNTTSISLSNQIQHSDVYEPCKLQMPPLIIDSLPNGGYILEIIHKTGGSLSSYTIDISCSNEPYQAYSYSQTHRCGDFISGQLSATQTKEYRWFESIRGQSSVTFNFEPQIALYSLYDVSSDQMVFEMVTQSITIVNEHSLQQSGFILSVTVNNTDNIITTPWQALVKCAAVVDEAQSLTPYVVDTVSEISWIDAQIQCMQIYGTSLGTMEERYWRLGEDLYSNVGWFDSDSGLTGRGGRGIAGDYDIWLYFGLYHNGTGNNQWEWSDGTACNGLCTDIDKNLILQPSEYFNYYGTQLHISILQRGIYTLYLDLEAVDPLNETEATTGDVFRGILCNGMIFLLILFNH